MTRSQTTSAGVGATRIETWRDGKRGAFCLMFDDSVPSHVKNVVPELKRRGLVGTFYVNPGTGHWKQEARAWEKEFPALPDVAVYANHTMTHRGARSVAELREEVRACSEVIHRLAPGPKPRLLSFGRPGVKEGDWTVTDAEVAAELKRHHLVERPPFGDHGAMIGPKTAEAMVAHADAAAKTGTLGYLVFHGVGGEWIATPADMFVRFLDGLEAYRDRLWITDHVSAHVYRTLRETSEARLDRKNRDEIQVSLTTRADRVLYDRPLTLVTQVPADWKRCAVKQAGATPRVVTPRAGAAAYEARPHLGRVFLTRA